jgi:hypothetical protein
MVPMKTILVCGGRKFNDWSLFSSTLDKICLDKGWITEPDEYGNWLPNVTIVHGGAKGADTLATDWAVINWCYLTVYPADWKTHGKAAGPVRNQKMLEQEKIDLVVAFPGGRGTADMVRRAKQAGIEVIEINE